MEFLKNLSEANGIEEIIKALKTFNDTEIKLNNIKTKNLKDARIKLRYDLYYLRNGFAKVLLMDVYKKYQKLARAEEKPHNVLFVGRLANYKYFNMDEAIRNVLNVFKSHSFFSKN